MVDTNNLRSVDREEALNHIFEALVCYCCQIHQEVLSKIETAIDSDPELVSPHWIEEANLLYAEAEPKKIEHLCFKYILDNLEKHLHHYASDFALSHSILELLQLSLDINAFFYNGEPENRIIVHILAQENTYAHSLVKVYYLEANCIYGELVELAEKMLSQGFNDVRFFYTSISGYLNTEQYDKALTKTQTALAIYPNNWSIIQQHCRALELLGKQEETLAVLKQTYLADCLDQTDRKELINFLILGLMVRIPIHIAFLKFLFKLYESNYVRKIIQFYLWPFLYLERQLIILYLLFDAESKQYFEETPFKVIFKIVIIFCAAGLFYWLLYRLTLLLMWLFLIFL